MPDSYILGISAYYHDSAACVLRNGQVVAIKNNIITFDSVSLEGDKGYARLKGRITNGYMNMALEIMPEAGKLTSLEKMLIGKYIVSPGYYVVPLKGPVM